MRPWITIGLVGCVVFVVLGVIITLVPRQRIKAEQEACKNNLRQLALFAALDAMPQKKGPRGELPHEIPAGTIVLPGIPPEARLSWIVAALPGFNQKQQDTMAIAARIDVSQPWAAAANQEAARRKLQAMLCPGNPPPLDPEQAAPTQYVGIAGLGVDPAELNYLPPGPASPRAGCFHYDSPTPFSAITDGLSQTLLCGERANDLGPWLRGGPATLRGLDDRPAAIHLLGPGGQFGGNHPFASNWALADGGVRTFTPNVDPKVLLEMATIAGQGSAAIPGE